MSNTSYIYCAVLIAAILPYFGSKILETGKEQKIPFLLLTCILNALLVLLLIIIITIQ